MCVKKNSISHEKFSSKSNYIDSIDEYDAQNASGFGELKSLIREYNLLAKELETKENLDTSKNSPENTHENASGENKTTNTEPTEPSAKTGENNVEDPNKIESSNTNKASLKLKGEYIKTETFNDRIDLKQFIECATDINGNNVDINNIKISSPDSVVDDNFIYSVKVEKTVPVEYEYQINDDISISKKLYITFLHKKTKAVTGNNQRNFIATFSNAENYKITECGNLSIIVNQLNEMYNDTNIYNAYKQVFACSLRVLFDIPTQILWHKTNSLKNSSAKKLILGLQTDNLINSSLYLFETFTKMLSDSKKKQKNQEYDAADHEFCENLINKFGISKDSIKNVYTLSDFDKYIRLTNSIAHNGPVNLTDDDIIKIGHYASFYIFLIDQILLNGKS